VRLARPLLLLALAALLAPRIEASHTSVLQSSPTAAAALTTTDAAGLLASLAPADDVDAAELLAFNLGDVVLVESELESEDRFGLGPLDLLGPAPLRGPPPSYPETRVRGFELLPPFRIGASASLSLWGRQAYGFSCREVVSDSRYDPWGLCAFGLPCPGWAQGAIDSVKEGFSAAGRTAAAGAERWGEELGGVAQYYDTMGRETAQAAKMAVAGKEESAGYTNAQKDWAARTLLGNFLQLWGLAEFAASGPRAPAAAAAPPRGSVGVAPGSGAGGAAENAASGRVFYGTPRGDLVVGPAELPSNASGGRVVVPEGHALSALDPPFDAPPIVRRGPFTTAQRDAFLRGSPGDSRLAPHHRGQVPLEHGGVIDELPGPGNPAGNAHTGQPRHVNPSTFNRMTKGKSLRSTETRRTWRNKGRRLVEVDPGVWIDPGGM
jgi:hypothetical protein